MVNSELADKILQARNEAQRRVVMSLRDNLRHILTMSTNQRDFDPVASDEDVYVAAKAFCDEYERSIPKEPLKRTTDGDGIAGSLRQHSKRTMDTRIKNPT